MYTMQIEQGLPFLLYTLYIRLNLGIKMVRDNIEQPRMRTRVKYQIHRDSNTELFSN